jgi:hypothetical protein
MFYKIVNNLMDIPADPYLTPSKTRTRTTHLKKMLQYHTRTDTLKFSFFPRTIPTWNILPATVAEAPDLVPYLEEADENSYLFFLNDISSQF